MSINVMRSLSCVFVLMLSSVFCIIKCKPNGVVRKCVVSVLIYYIVGVVVAVVCLNGGLKKG